jgi:hypothetical protein
MMQQGFRTSYTLPYRITQQLSLELCFATIVGLAKPDWILEHSKDDLPSAASNTLLIVARIDRFNDQKKERRKQEQEFGGKVRARGEKSRSSWI